MFKKGLQVDCEVSVCEKKLATIAIRRRGGRRNESGDAICEWRERAE